jgi:hypothetical protein
MIPREFIPYEQAIELKELGFDKESFNRFYTKPKCKMFGIDEKGRTYPIKNTPKKLYTIGECCVLNEDNVITAPTFSQAFRWFREKHGLASHIATYWQHDWNNYSYQYYFVEDKIEWNGIEHYKTYEEAELACLKKLIEIVKQEQNEKRTQI